MTRFFILLANNLAITATASSTMALPAPMKICRTNKANIFAVYATIEQEKSELVENLKLVRGYWSDFEFSTVWRKDRPWALRHVYHPTLVGADGLGDSTDAMHLFLHHPELTVGNEIVVGEPRADGGRQLCLSCDPRQPLPTSYEAVEAMVKEGRQGGGGGGGHFQIHPRKKLTLAKAVPTYKELFAITEQSIVPWRFLPEIDDLKYGRLKTVALGVDSPEIYELWRILQLFIVFCPKGVKMRSYYVLALWRGSPLAVSRITTTRGFTQPQVEAAQKQWKKAIKNYQDRKAEEHRLKVEQRRAEKRALKEAQKRALKAQNGEAKRKRQKATATALPEAVTSLSPSPSSAPSPFPSSSASSGNERSPSGSSGIGGSASEDSPASSHEGARVVIASSPLERNELDDNANDGDGLFSCFNSNNLDLKIENSAPVQEELLSNDLNNCSLIFE